MFVVSVFFSSHDTVVIPFSYRSKMLALGHAHNKLIHFRERYRILSLDTSAATS
jgi:hypothetical protein